jgi:Zn-dependent peptidase ImmA (M78 family)
MNPVTTAASNPETTAADIVTTVWTHGDDPALPVDPSYIAGKLGVKVFTAGLDDQISGMLVKRPAQDPEIYLNATDSTNRQRFTCAHELGHYVMRTSTETLGDSWEFIDLRDPLSADGTKPDEIWANKFAAALLMPADLVKKMAKDHNVASLAYEFGVSTDAMGFRLQNLGLT